MCSFSFRCHFLYLASVIRFFFPKPRTSANFHPSITSLKCSVLTTFHKCSWWASWWLRLLLFDYCLLTCPSGVDAAGGRGAKAGGGGATGVRIRHKEGDNSGTLNVILVVILPVAQMIGVLVIVCLVRICYVKYCQRPADPKLLEVVSTVTEQIRKAKLATELLPNQEQRNHRHDHF